MIDLNNINTILEFEDQFLDAQADFQKAKQYLDRINRYTTQQLNESYSFENRKKIISSLYDTSCPKIKISELEELHIKIFDSYQEDFNSEKSKADLFLFNFLLKDVINYLPDGEAKKRKRFGKST